MSLERFQFTQPAKFQGLEDLAPPEINNYVLEANRRLILNFEGLVSNLREQVIVDSSIVPSATDSSTANVATTADTDNSKVFSMLWDA